MAAKLKPSFRFVEHTADIMLQSQGKDFAAALEQAAAAMFFVLGRGLAKPSESFEIEEGANSREELVVNFLSRIHSECEARELTPSKAEIRSYDEKKLLIRAKIYGDAKMRPKDAIKAVTHHELKIDEGASGCRLQVLLDV